MTFPQSYSDKHADVSTPQNRADPGSPINVSCNFLRSKSSDMIFQNLFPIFYDSSEKTIKKWTGQSDLGNIEVTELKGQISRCHTGSVLCGHVCVLDGISPERSPAVANGDHSPRRLHLRVLLDDADNIGGG